MSRKLFANAIGKFTLGVVLIGLLLFAPAGTFYYPNAWLLMGILFVPMLLAGIVLLVKNPMLLEKRLNMREKIQEQSTVVKLSGLMFTAGFVLAALDFRFSWLPFPKSVSYIGTTVFLAAYLMYGEVLRENTYLSRTVEVQAGQKVVDTGLYRIVRHPMYCATVFLFLSIPMVLGSVLSLAVFLSYPFLIAKRIKSEEQLLKEELPGYTEYQTRVRYRLIPFVW